MKRRCSNYAARNCEPPRSIQPRSNSFRLLLLRDHVAFSFIMMVDLEPELVVQAEIEENIAGWADWLGRSAVPFFLRFLERREATADLLGGMPAFTAFGE